MRQFIKSAFVLIVALFACREARAEMATHIALHGEEVSYLGGEVNFPEIVLMNVGVARTGNGATIEPQSHSIVFTTEDEWDDEFGPGIGSICMPNWVESFNISVDYRSESVKCACRYSDVDHIEVNVDGHLSKIFSSSLIGGQSGRFTRTYVDPVTTKGHMKIKPNYGSQRRVFKLWCADNVFGDISGGSYQSIESMNNTFAWAYVVTQLGQGFKLDYERSQGQVDWDVVGMHTGEGDDIDDFGVLTIPRYSVKSIADRAFVNCEFSATKVVLPGGNFTVGSCAFSGCSSLQSIEIVDSGKMCFDIGDYAFDGCTGLTSVHFPACVNKVGKGAFAHCSNLREFTVDDANSMSLSVRNGCLCDKLGLTFLACPATFTSVTIPSSITSIQYGAFMGCDNLTEVTTEPGREDWVAEQMLAAGFNTDQVLFNGKHYDVDLCEVIFELGWEAGARRVGGGELVQYVKRGGSAVEPIVATEEGWNADGWYSQLENIQENYTIIRLWCYSDEEILATANGIIWRYTADENGATIHGGKDVAGRRQFDMDIPSELDGYKVTAIGDWAFSDYNDGLTSVTIPEGVTSIGDVAFRSCYGLTSLTIPESVTNVGEAAFIYCDGLKSMTIPSGVTSIGEDAFMGCSKMEVFSVDQANTAYCSQNGLLCSKDGKTLIAGVIGDVIIPEGVVTIANDAFMYLYGLTSVALPSSLSSIGADAFWECGQLQSLVIPEGVTNIGYGAFASCRSLRSVCFAGDVPVVDETVYDYSENLATCVREGTSGWDEVPGEWCGRPIEWWDIYPEVYGVEKSVEVGGRTWRYCLKKGGAEILGCDDATGELVIPSELDGHKVTAIGVYAFESCAGMTAVEIPSCVTSIGRSAFGWCSGLLSITIPQGVTSIGSQAFHGCHGLTSVTIPSSVTSIGLPAFSFCNGLKSLLVDSSNPVYCSKNGLICSKNGLTVIAGVNGDVVIPEGVTSIGEYAFFNCEGLASVMISEIVTNIGYRAFDACHALRSVCFVGDKPMTGEAIYDDSDAVTTYVREGASGWGEVPGEWCGRPIERWTDYPEVYGVEESVEVGGRTWRYCLQKSGVEILGCDDATGELVIPSELGGRRVTAIGDNAFYQCWYLTSVTMPKGMTSIGDKAFFNCSRLTSVTIPLSVTKIGTDAFRYCSGLLRVVVDWDDSDRVAELLEDSGLDVSNLTVAERGDSSLVISPDKLEKVMIGEAYSQQFTVSGGQPPYAWSVREQYNESRGTSTFAMTGTAQGWSGDDNCWVYDLPFAFPFYGSRYSKVCVNSNGTLAFDSSFSGYGESEAELKNRAMIAPLWDDLNLSSGDVFVTTGEEFVTIRWSGIYYGGTAVNFSATLYNDGKIRLSYGSGNANGGLIGVSAGDGERYFISSSSKSGSMENADDILIDAGICGLPEGLALSTGGLLSGTPTKKGRYVFAVAATDAEGCGNRKDMQIVVAGYSKVTFDLCEYGTRTGGGELVQEVVDGEAAVAPEVAAKEDYEFYGWDTEFSNVTGPMTVHARYVKDGQLPDGDGYTEDVNGYLWAFSIVNGEAVIEPGISPEPIGELVIPSELGGCLVTTIAESAFDNDFADMSGLTSVTIPAGVIAIGDYAFWGCSALQTVIYEGDEDEIDFGHSVFEDTPYERNQPFSLIMDGTIVTGFKGAIPQSLVIPDGVTEIGDGAFEYCEGLRSVVIPESVTYIGDYAFADCDGLRSVSFIGGMPEISCAIYGEEDCVTTYVREGTSGWDEVPGEWCGRPIEWWKTYPDVYDEEKTVEVDGRTWRYCLQKDGAEILGCDDVSGDLVIPAGLGGHKVTAIGGRSFEHCDELTSVTIPEGVTSIGEGAFCECNGLTEVVIPPGVESIGDYAFVSCYRLTSVAIPEGVTSIGDYAFEWCVCLRSVALPSSLTTIGEYAFYYCPDMRTITIPPSVISIGEGAFCDCEALKAVLFSGDRPEVGDAIYDGANSATTYVREGTSGWGEVPGEWCGRPIEWWTTYPDVPVDETETVEDGVYVVSKDGYDWTVTVEYGEVWIGDRNAWLVTEAAISPKPHGALEIPDEFFGLPVVGLSMAAFMGCEELTEVSLPQTMYSVPGCAFWGTSLQTINVDEENSFLRMQDGFLVNDWQTAILAVGKTGACAIPNGVASVPMGAFVCCPEITDLSLPSSVEVFDVAAVDDCAALLSITVEEDNPNFKSANGFLLSKDGTSLAVCPGGIADVVVPNGVTAIGVVDNYSGDLLSPFPCGSKMQSIAIPASVEQIDGGVFTECSALTEITVDSGNAVYTAANGLLMTADGKTLLACAGGCVDVVIPDGVTEICGSAFVNNSFMGNYSLRSVTVPSSVCHIEAGAFSCCYYLTSVCFAGAAPKVDDSDGWTYDLYEGSDYVTTYVQQGSQGWGEVPGTWHERPIKWWTSDNPSPIPELDDDADVNQVYMALHGSKDDKLVDNILMTCLTEGDVAGADLYNNYRLWAGRVRDEKGDPLGLKAVRNSPTAWTSFALDQTTLLERNLTDEDLKIEEFKPSMEAGTFDFTVSIKDVAVGPLAMAENLKKTFGLKGTTELVSSAFDEANVDVEFGMPENGKLKFTAEPLDKDAKSFFMKMKVR